MRGATHLKAVRDTGEKGAVPITSGEHAPETRGSWLENTRLPALVDEMERMMNEVFHRPMAGFGTMPWRGLLGEFGKAGTMSPAVDIFEDEGAIVVKADLPGLSRNDIEVKLVENTLEIIGEKKTEEKVDRRDYLRLERSYGKFSRVLRLPEGLDTEHIIANFSDGVLEVKLPKIAGKRTVKHISIK
jgi:HSP20 family protein